MGLSEVFQALSTVQSLSLEASSLKVCCWKKVNGTRVLPFSDASRKGRLILRVSPSSNWGIVRSTNRMHNSTWETLVATVTTTIGSDEEKEEPANELEAEEVAVSFEQVDSTVLAIAEPAPTTDIESLIRQPPQRHPGKIRTVQKFEIVPGAVFKGKVVSILPFGAFVDIGAFTNGLVHISQLSSGHVRAIQDFVKVGQEVEVVVINTQFELNRISLGLKEVGSEPWESNSEELQAGKMITVQKFEIVPGAVFKGKVVSILPFGVFVDIGAFTNGFVHISRLSNNFVKAIEDIVKVGQEVEVVVVDTKLEFNRISLQLIETKTDLEKGETDEQLDSSKKITVKMFEIVPGAVFKGRVTSILPFGAFVDIGAFTNGLVHISQLSSHYVNAVQDVVKVGQEVEVVVLDTKFELNRISLRLKEAESEIGNSDEQDSGKIITVQKFQIVPGAVFKGKVVSILPFGALVDIGAFTAGFVHISRLSSSYVKVVEDIVKVGQEVEVIVEDTKFELNRISLRLKEAESEIGNSDEQDSGKIITVQKFEIVRGAVFKGKVVSILPFGALVDIGAFTAGFVHISRLSSSYVKVVEDIVKVGQEVEVIVEDTKFELNRISLRLKEAESEIGNSNEQDSGKIITVQKFEIVPGAVFKGKVVSILPFGALVDIGAFTAGFVHISRLSSSYVKVVEDIVKVGQEVEVIVEDAKFELNRISLRLKEAESEIGNSDEQDSGKIITVQKSEILPGAVFKGKVVSILPFGALVDIGAFTAGFVHISRLSSSYVKVVEDIVKVGQEVEVIIEDTKFEINRIYLRLKEADLGSEVLLEKSNSDEHVDSGKVITVQKYEIVPGAVFKGKVVSILPFGAFVDIGAFTNGLVHISQLSNSYVKTVEDIVKVGQEVEVTVTDTKFEFNRISLRLNDTETKAEEVLAFKPSETDKKAEFMNRWLKQSGSKLFTGKHSIVSQTAHKLKVGQIVNGVVKNFAGRGVFISLPEGEEGLLKREDEGGVLLENRLKIGQEVKVRVLKVVKGRIFLSMKQTLDIEQINIALNADVEGATNPFYLAFQQNEAMARFLADRKNAQRAMDVKVGDDIQEAEVSMPESRNAVSEAGVVDSFREVTFEDAAILGDKNANNEIHEEEISFFVDTGSSEGVDVKEDDNNVASEAQLHTANVPYVKQIDGVKDAGPQKVLH